MRFIHFWIVLILPYAVPIFCALKANIQAIIITGNAVAIANNTGKRYPAVAVADIGISIPK